eukprot:1402310-Amphidinium_carterae.1
MTCCCEASRGAFDDSLAVLRTTPPHMASHENAQRARRGSDGNARVPDIARPKHGKYFKVIGGSMRASRNAA